MNKKLIGIFVFLLLFSSVVLPVSGDITIWKKNFVEEQSSYIELSEEFYESKYKDVNYHYRYMTEDGKIHTVTKSRIELFAELANNLEKNDTSNIIIENSEGDHPPIYINGNDDFTPENGVTGGNGTLEDPFIIENWVIVGNGSAENGICIKNTDSYFIINNCTTSNFLGRFYNGIGFFNVENGKIEHSEMFNNYHGIGIYDSSYIEILNCASHDNNGEYAKGISGSRCSNIKINSCYCYSNKGRVTWGLSFYRSNNIVIENSTCYDNIFDGIYLYTDSKEDYPCVYNIIKDCKIYDNTGNGIYLESTSHEKHAGYNLITGCEIYNNGHWENPPVDNAMPGIVIWNLHNNIIENCDIHHNGDGIHIAECSDNIIRNCSIHDQWMPRFMGNGILIGGWQVDLAFARDNVIEHCDIYNQDCGIWNTEALGTKVNKNNIFKNNYEGISVLNFLGVSSVKINYNNISGNGYMDDKYGYGLIANFLSFVNARNNWWGAKNGPDIYYYINFLNFQIPLRPWGNGNKIMKSMSIVSFRPWAKEPISDAGVQ